MECEENVKKEVLKTKRRINLRIVISAFIGILIGIAYMISINAYLELLKW